MGTKSLIDMIPHLRGHKKESLLHKLLRVCCVKPLVWYARKSDLLDWYRKELDFTLDYLHQTAEEYCTPADPYDEDTEALLSLYYFLTESLDRRNYRSITEFGKLAGLNPMSPLTFADNEFNEVADNIWQSKRIASVFKEKDGTYRDLDAIGWESVYYIDLLKRKVEASPIWSGSCHVYSSGVTWLYDDINDYVEDEKDRWMPVDATGIIKNFKNYENTERFYLQCIEMNTWEQDPTTDDDTKGEWRTVRLCFRSSIPEKYLERYELRDAREDALKDEDDQKEYAKDLDYLMEHHLEKFLYRLMSNQLKDHPVEVGSDDEIFDDDYSIYQEDEDDDLEAEISDTELIEIEFETKPEKKQEYDKYAQDIIYKLMDDYDISAEQIHVTLDEDNLFKKMTIEDVPYGVFKKFKEEMEIFKNEEIEVEIV